MLVDVFRAPSRNRIDFFCDKTFFLWNHSLLWSKVFEFYRDSCSSDSPGDFTLSFSILSLWSLFCCAVWCRWRMRETFASTIEVAPAAAMHTYWTLSVTALCASCIMRGWCHHVMAPNERLTTLSMKCCWKCFIPAMCCVVTNFGFEKLTDGIDVECLHNLNNLCALRAMKSASCKRIWLIDNQIMVYKQLIGAFSRYYSILSLNLDLGLISII